VSWRAGWATTLRRRWALHTFEGAACLAACAEPTPAATLLQGLVI
jgi:hypothetical protein